MAGGIACVLLAACSAANPKPHPQVSDAKPATTVRQDVTSAPAPMRRLTKEEYNNSVRDLLGVTARPADAFPPDEVVAGFENNTVAPVTQALVEQYQVAAESMGPAAIERLDTLAPCAGNDLREACARAFIERFGRLVFRRPLEEGEQRGMFAIYSEKQRHSDYAHAIQLVVEAMLQSPAFLYRAEPADDRGAKARALTGYEIATRLSYFITASTPDGELLDAAANGKLSTPEGLEQASRRLLAGPHAVDGVRSFHRQWLSLRELDTQSKDAALYPSFTRELRESMVEETLRFSERAVLGGGDAVTTLLTSNRSFVNASLAKLYGLPALQGDSFVSVELSRAERSGVLTQASVMTVLANADQTSPIFRGKFVREKLLCQPIPPPPPNVDISPPKFDPALTKRERFVRHRTDPSCAGCHQKMDPIGFGFEHYDALGAWRTVDGAFLVDAAGAITGTDDADGPFDGVVALGARLATSKQVRRCITTQWFRAAMGRVERSEDAASLDASYDAFSRAGFDVRELIVAIAKSDAFRHVGFEGGSAP